MTGRLVKAFLVPVLVALYIFFFWRSTSGMPLGGQGVPRLLIGILALLLVIIVIREVVELRRGEPEAMLSEELSDPYDADSAGGALLRAEAFAAAQGPAEPTGPIGPTDAEHVTPPVNPTSLGPPIAIVVGLFAYWYLLTKIGAYPSTALFVVGLSLAMGYRRPLPIIGAAAVCVVTVYAFIQIFTLPLSGFAFF